MKFCSVSTLSTIAVLATCLSVTSCTVPQSSQPTPQSTSQPTTSQPVESPVVQSPPQVTPVTSPQGNASPVAQRPAPTPEQPPLADLEPEVGIIRQIQSGDLMCYITFTDEGGTQQTVGATFELCENSQSYLNQRVRLVYGIRSVNDCQSNEPCGKTRKTHLVVRMDKVDAAGRNQPPDSPDSTVLRNGEWTIAIGNRNSWSGVNGTGNLTYRGCNRKQDCIDLAGGTITCRSGICSTTWVNGAYSYTLLTPMTEAPATADSTLVVRRDDRVLKEITGLR